MMKPKKGSPVGAKNVGSAHPSVKRGAVTKPAGGYNKAGTAKPGEKLKLSKTAY